MNHGVNPVGREQQLCRHRIAEIHLHERNILHSGDLLDSLVAGLIAVGHIIGHDHIVAGLDKFHGDVASDKSGTAGHKDAFFHIQ